MMVHKLKSIKNIRDAAKRGYAFEKYIKEFFRASSAGSVGEQIDGVASINGIPYLIEAKAKSNRIRRYSSDWEDFELKLRRRRGTCHGIFCSLNPVDVGMIESAKELNRNNIPIIIMHDGIWDKFQFFPIPIDYFLKLMELQIHIKYDPIPNFGSIKRQYVEGIELELTKFSKKASSLFIGRHYPEELKGVYVHRKIDEITTQLIHNLKPTRLIVRGGVKKENRGQTAHRREAPTQISIIRDISGAGKTSFVANTATTTSNAIVVCRSAYESNIDDFCHLFQNAEEASILNMIICTDKPLVYIIDALDEATWIRGKSREVISIVKKISELNDIAFSRRDMPCFPIAIIFLIRDEYWRDWESVLKEYKTKTYINRFSRFSKTEFIEALDKYSSYYGYTFNQGMDETTFQTLSIPFYLSIFSHTNRGNINIDLNNIFEEYVLRRYIECIYDNILNKRSIPLVNKVILRNILINIALLCLEADDNIISHNNFRIMLRDQHPSLTDYYEDILRALLSEGIVIAHPISRNSIKIRHQRIIEYLIACKLLYIAEENNNEFIDQLIEDALSSRIISVIQVHEYIKCFDNKEHQNATILILDIMTSNLLFMREAMALLRYKSSRKSISRQDAYLVERCALTEDSEAIFNSFFAFAARHNHSKTAKVKELFINAWKNTKERSDRWKMILKLGYYKLLCDEDVFILILSSSTSKELEVYLGSIIESNNREEFCTLWEQRCGEKYISEKDSNEFYRVALKLVDTIVNKKQYIPGVWN